MTGYELDTVELGERVALGLKPAACSCRWHRKASGRTRWVPCADHTPEPQDWTYIRVSAEIKGTKIQASSPAD